MILCRKAFIGNPKIQIRECKYTILISAFRPHQTPQKVSRIDEEGRVNQ